MGPGIGVGHTCGSFTKPTPPSPTPPPYPKKTNTETPKLAGEKENNSLPPLRGGGEESCDTRHCGGHVIVGKLQMECTKYVFFNGTNCTSSGNKEEMTSVCGHPDHYQQLPSRAAHTAWGDV